MSPASLLHGGEQSTFCSVPLLQSTSFTFLLSAAQVCRETRAGRDQIARQCLAVTLAFSTGLVLVCGDCCVHMLAQVTLYWDIGLSLYFVHPALPWAKRLFVPYLSVSNRCRVLLSGLPTHPNLGGENKLGESKGVAMTLWLGSDTCPGQGLELCRFRMTKVERAAFPDLLAELHRYRVTLLFYSKGCILTCW